MVNTSISKNEVLVSGDSCLVQPRNGEKHKLQKDRPVFTVGIYRTKLCKVYNATGTVVAGRGLQHND